MASSINVMRIDFSLDEIVGRYFVRFHRSSHCTHDRHLHSMPPPHIQIGTRTAEVLLSQQVIHKKKHIYYHKMRAANVKVMLGWGKPLQPMCKYIWHSHAREYAQLFGENYELIIPPNFFTWFTSLHNTPIGIGRYLHRLLHTRQPIWKTL